MARDRRRGFRFLNALLCALCILSGGVSGQLEAQAPQSKAPSSDSFVKIVKGEFTIGCETFYPAIWNQWEVIECAAGAPTLYGASLPPGVTGPELIRSIMDQAPAAGLTVMRAWAASVDSTYALQTQPGVYNEAVFRGLDYALDEARKRNLKVILALVDYWQEGVERYVEWTADPSLQTNHFFNDSRIMGWYKDWLKTITSRINTINGRRYSEDPTIMAWDLINEPRCQGCKPNQIAEWIGTMAAHLKQLDPNHLVTVGEDGFYSTTTWRQDANPVYEPRGSPWAHNEGQDFIVDHSSPDIDFAAFHMWPDNWQVITTNVIGNIYHNGPVPIAILLQSEVDETVREDFVRNWVAVHAEDATNILNKPVILEEFGKWANNSIQERNAYFGFAFDESNIWINNGSALKGIGFWEWYDVGQVAPASEGGGAGLYGITTNDSTWGVVSREMNALTANNGDKAQPCTPSSAPVVPAQDCSSMRVRNLPGTGFEGPECDVDVNECARGTDNCSLNSTCINTRGGFECQCWAGFTGDGSSCTPSAEVAKLEESYQTGQIQGPLVCDIRYPRVAPGVIEDPTGATLKANLSIGEMPGVGSPGPVKSLTECLIACESAPGCSIAVYSPDSLDCLLKGCPSKHTVACPVAPPPGSPGALDGPPLPPPSPPTPQPPPCTLPPSLCPTKNATFESYYSTLRYDQECTQWAGNPGIAFVPAPAVKRVIPLLSPDTPPVSTASELGPAAALFTAAPQVPQAANPAASPAEIASHPSLHAHYAAQDLGRLTTSSINGRRLKILH